jgi:site-specific recombinase XerD
MCELQFTVGIMSCTALLTTLCVKGGTHPNDVIAGNPAETVTRARKEEKDPTVLFKNEYKALLFEAQGNSRDYAILLTFLKSGIRESELADLQIDDVDFLHNELTVREGKGKKERSIPLMPELKRALGRYIAEREQQANIIDEETLFLAKNGTSLNPSSIRKLVKKYYTKAGGEKIRSTYPPAYLQRA